MNKKRWPQRIAIFSLAISITSISHSASADDQTPNDTITSTSAVQNVDSTTTSITPTSEISRDITLQPEDIVKISRINTKKPVVFITIDDGATVSKELADVIDKNHVPVTTFAMPGMIWRARWWYRARENMTFENHTNTHAHMTTISIRNQTIELCWTNKLIRQMIGTAPRFYRPPRGSWSDKNRIAMARCNLKYAVFWSIVVTNTGADKLVFRPGDIILFHYVPSLPGALLSVLEKLKEENLRPALLRDYLK